MAQSHALEEEPEPATRHLRLISQAETRPKRDAKRMLEEIRALEQRWGVRLYLAQPS